MPSKTIRLRQARAPSPQRLLRSPLGVEPTRLKHARLRARIEEEELTCLQRGRSQPNEPALATIRELSSKAT